MSRRDEIVALLEGAVASLTADVEFPAYSLSSAAWRVADAAGLLHQLIDDTMPSKRAVPGVDHETRRGYKLQR